MGGGSLNHNIYWECIGPNGNRKPIGEVKKGIEKSFESFEKFVDKFSGDAAKLFGSGWTWLCLD